MSETLIIFACLICLLLWVIWWYFIFKYFLKSKIDEANKTSAWILEEANRKSIEISQEIKEWRKLLEQEKEKVARNFEKTEEKLQHKEERLEKKEEQLDLKISEMSEKKEELEEVIKEQRSKLTQLSNLTEQEAKDKLFDIVKSDNEKDIVAFIDKFKTIKEEESKYKAVEIISKVLPRVAMTEISEFSVSTVDLPTEDTKWKIIWREWRNIAFFERLTWVELLIDDTPLAVKLSSFDSEKRFIATETLRRLIKDWRINPIYIEKIFKAVEAWMDEIHMEKWKEALTVLNLPMMKPDIVKFIWKFNLRYSYGQNLWIHSIEVARISELLANEFWLDWILAKKAGLLHDIWKIIAWNWEAHAKVWWDLLRKYWFNDIIVNSAEWHHFDVELNHPISWIVTAADAISAWRPWARFNTKELFIERMWNLEKLITSITWIDKVYIMQAWREIMVFVDPWVISDLNLEEVVKNIWERIEWQLDYPWVIRIVAIRESKVTSYLR